ncbi:MAG: hypothetical protein MRY32_06830 [Rickettsiales bacterium]|nr:hypothetical protein [Rickettsiales bacterium]
MAQAIMDDELMEDELLEDGFVEDEDFEEEIVAAKPRVAKADFTVDDLIAVTASLARLLAKEADLLEEMKIQEMADLQDEKLGLVEVIQQMKGYMDRHPEIINALNVQERDDLRQVVTIFQQILDENYRRLSMARAVNQKVVQAIKEVVHETSASDAYDKKGAANHSEDGVSLSLNEKV